MYDRLETIANIVYNTFKLSVSQQTGKMFIFNN